MAILGLVKVVRSCPPHLKLVFGDVSPGIIGSYILDILAPKGHLKKKEKHYAEVWVKTLTVFSSVAQHRLDVQQGQLSGGWAFRS